MFTAIVTAAIIGGCLALVPMMAPLPQADRDALARLTDDALNYARGQAGLTWDQLAAEMLLNPSQLKRMRNGQDAFDFRRLLLLPAPVFAAFQSRALELKDATDDAAALYLANLFRSFMASRGARMVRATVPAFEARKGQCA
jgi:hypothetical protein